MSVKQLSLLINLAKVDGVIADEELSWIQAIGRAHGLDEAQVDKLIASPTLEVDTHQLSDDQRFDYIYSIVQLMKIDGKLFRSEMQYCNEIAEKLGYDRAVLFELMTRIYSDPSITSDKDVLKRKVQKYLKK